MSPHLSRELQRAFDLASLRFEASQGLSADAWQHYREITGRYEAERKRKKLDYRREYDTRVEAARARLIEDAARHNRNYRPRFGAHDPFEPARIERQAHRQVKAEHAADMARLEEREGEELRTLVQEARQSSATVAVKLSKDGAPAVILNTQEYRVKPSRPRSR